MYPLNLGFPGTIDDKESAFNAGDIGLIAGHVDPLEKRMATHSSILAMDSGAWQAKAHRIVKSLTWLSN